MKSAKKALGARGFDSEALDRLSENVLTAVDSYTVYQSLKDGWLK